MVSLSRFVGDLALALEPGLAPLLLHRLRDGVQFWDDAGQLLYANPATCRQFGVDLAVGAVADAMLANSLDLHGQPLAVAEFPIRRVQAGAEEADVLVQISPKALALCLRTSHRQVQSLQVLRAEFFLASPEVQVLRTQISHCLLVAAVTEPVEPLTPTLTCTPLTAPDPH